MLRMNVGMIAIALVAVAGCGGGGGETREPGEVAAQYQGAIASSDVARGEELYNGICMSCHAGGAPALDNLGWEAGAMRQQVREGQGRMPAIAESRVSRDDLEAILAYLVSIGAVQGAASDGAGAAEPTSGDEAAEAPAEESADLEGL